MKQVNFLDLKDQYAAIKEELLPALREALRRSDFILGKDVALFENDFARYCGKRFAVGVNSGTDALFLGLLSLGIGPGDEVIVPDFTYIATAFAVSYTGAKPVFVDIDPRTYCLDNAKVREAITRRTKAVIPVHLYGHSVDMAELCKIAKAHRLKVIEDTAQAHGCLYRYKGKARKAGSMGDIGCFSFYPTKNLGAFGDGGIVVTDNQEAYRRLTRLRDYGRRSRYEHVSIGYNSRLDTVQAAVLRAKLPHLDSWNTLRRRNAFCYNRLLKGVPGIITPFEAPYTKHVYHIYAVRVPNRDEVVQKLSEAGIGVLIHYPVPLHLQEAYASLGYKKGDFPVSERIASEILSLPMHPHLKESQIKTVCSVLKRIVKGDC